MNHKKLTKIANIAYSTLLLTTGILFYILFPVKEIGSNYSRLVISPCWVPINILAMVTMVTEALIFKNTGYLSFYTVFTLLFIIGYIVFGIGSTKAKVFPKWALILFIIGAPAYSILLSIPPFGLVGLVLYCLSIFAYGLTLFNRKTGVIK